MLQSIRRKVKNPFGSLNITWPKLIVFAVAAGIYTGVMAMLPMARDTSFADIGITFEWWVLFGILKVVLVAGVLFYFIDSVDKKEIFIKHEVKEDSVAYKHLSPVMSHVLEWKETRELEKEQQAPKQESCEK